MTRTRTLFNLLLAAALVAVAAPSLHAQAVKLPFANGDSAYGVLTTDDTDIAILIKHVGTSASGTVQVSSGDVLLKVGAEGAEAADTTITGCGGTAGTLDVDNAACDTLGELVDRINLSANWRAVILDGIRSDNDAGNKLLDMAATAATSEDGKALVWDTSVVFKATVCLGCPRTIHPYLGNGGVSPPFVPNPYFGRRVIVFHFDETSTYGSGTSTAQLLSALTTNKAGGTGSETVKTVYSLAGGATTVNKTIFDAAWGYMCDPYARCLVRINNSAAGSAILINAYGVIFRYPPLQ